MHCRIQIGFTVFDCGYDTHIHFPIVSTTLRFETQLSQHAVATIEADKYRTSVVPDEVRTVCVDYRQLQNWLASSCSLQSYDLYFVASYFVLVYIAIRKVPKMRI